MKKIVLWTLLVLTPFLASCGLNKNSQWGTGEKEAVKVSPQELIKQTQVNFANSFSNTLFNVKEWIYNINLKLAVNSPVWNGNIEANIKWKWNSKKENKWNINLNANYDLNWQKWDIKADLDFITNKEKFFFNLNSFVANSQDPRLAMINSYVKDVKGKWIYIVNPNINKNNNLNVNFVNKLKKYNLFKVNKELWNNKYEVSLDKDNIAKLSYEINQDLWQWTWISIDDIKNNLTWVDMNWVLEINADKKHFIFSWYAIDKNSNEKTKFTFKNLSNKLYIETEVKPEWKIVLDLDKNGDSFSWKLIVTQNGQDSVFNLSWKLTKNDFVLNVSTNINNFKIDFKSSTNIEEKKDIKVEIPKDAISVQELQQQMIEKQSQQK